MSNNTNELGRSVPDGLSSSGSSPQAVSPVPASIPSAEDRPWPLCGYAPGHYMGRCIKCATTFEGDKRSLECLECAAVSAKFLMRRSRELRGAAINLHDTIVLWTEYGGPVLPRRVVRAMLELINIIRDSDGSGEADETPKSGSTEGDSAGPSGHRQEDISNVQ